MGLSMTGSREKKRLMLDWMCVFPCDLVFLNTLLMLPAHHIRKQGGGTDFQVNGLSLNSVPDSLKSLTQLTQNTLAIL